MEKEEFWCFKCNVFKSRNDFHERSQHGRPVAYHCKECRKNRIRSSETWNRAFKKYGTVCDGCDWPKPLLNGVSCAQCLKDQGFKRCIRCNEIKLYNLEFYPKRGVCIKCLSSGYSEDRIEESPKSKLQVDKYILKKYNITIVEYERLYDLQEGKCAICQCIPDSRLCIDHDHQTKRVRGLLCSRCNLGLGGFRDDPVIISRARAYIIRPTTASAQEHEPEQEPPELQAA